MTKQQITIEVPDGKEVVGVDYRWQTNSEICLTAKIADAWQWPTWLKCEAIAMDQSGNWFAYKESPKLTEGGWHHACARLPIECWTDFTPPPCTDWRQSKRRRPA